MIYIINWPMRLDVCTISLVDYTNSVRHHHDQGIYISEAKLFKGKWLIKRLLQNERFSGKK